jgi:hypothetical protein
MSETKHTPGPFTVAGPSYDRLDPTKCGDYALVNGNGHIVAEAFRLVAEDIELPAKANAYLFAAAPDLYAAASYAFNHLDNPAVSDYTRTEALRLLAEAMRVAEGRGWL